MGAQLHSNLRTFASLFVALKEKGMCFPKHLLSEDDDCFIYVDCLFKKSL